MKKFKVWCKGISDDVNFNTPRWISLTDCTFTKYYNLTNIFDDPNFVLCQYIGLKDSYGVEIYEWDVLQYFTDEDIEIFNRGINGVGAELKVIRVRDITDHENMIAIKNAINEESFKYMKVMTNIFQWDLGNMQKKEDLIDLTYCKKHFKE